MPTAPRERPVRVVPTDPVAAGRAALHGLIEEFHAAWRTSLRALDELDAKRLALARLGDLDVEDRLILELIGALVDLRHRRPEAIVAARTVIQRLPGSPQLADPAIALFVAYAAMSLAEPELTRPLARACLSSTTLPTAWRSRLCIVVGVGDAWSGELVLGQLGLLEARELAHSVALPSMEAEATCVLAKIEALRGELDAAQFHLDEGRELGARVGSEWIAGGQLECALPLHLVRGDGQAYRAILEIIVQERHGLGTQLLWEYAAELATIVSLAGDPAAALRILADLPPAPPGLPGGSVLAAWSRWIAQPTDPARARELEVAADGLDRPAERLLAARVPWILGSQAAAAHRRGDALRLLETAASRYIAIGALGPLGRVRGELADLAQVPADLAARTGSEVASRDTHDPGRGSDDGVPGTRHTLAEVASLTESERRVAIAVSAGLTNREVAEALFLSVRTVESHLASIFRKLGVRNRTELALRR